MCGVWVCVVICGVDDVVNSGSEVWDGDGRCFESNGCVSGCRMGAVPRAMMLIVLDGW